MEEWSHSQTTALDDLGENVSATTATILACPDSIDEKQDSWGLTLPNHRLHPVDASTQTDHVIIIPIPDPPATNVRKFATVESVGSSEAGDLDPPMYNSDRVEQLINQVNIEENGNHGADWNEDVDHARFDQPSITHQESIICQFDQMSHQNHDHDLHEDNYTDQIPLDVPSMARTEKQSIQFNQMKFHPQQMGDTGDEIRDNGFIKLSTHDTSLASEKIPSIKTFAKDLEDAVNLALSSTNRSRYKYVYVLLMSWADDDLNIDEEVNQLGFAFSQYYNFDVQYFKIPRRSPGLSANSRIISFIEKGGIDKLLIVYYAGHARLSHEIQPPIWVANQHLDSPTLPSCGIQQLLEESSSDVLLLYDCCHSSHPAVNITGKGVTELLAACAFETQTPAPGALSFTNGLIKVLEQSFWRPPVTVATIHRQLMGIINKWQPNLLKEDGKVWLDAKGQARYESYKPRTPVRCVLTEEKVSRAIILSPLPPKASQPTYNGDHQQMNLPRQDSQAADCLQLNGVLQTSEPPKNNTGDPAITASAQRDRLTLQQRDPENKEKLKELGATSHQLPEVVTATEQLDVLLVIRLEEDIGNDEDSDQKKLFDLCEWLKNIPHGREFIKIQGIYRSNSTIVLLTLPVGIWDLLPENPAYSSIGFVDPMNLALSSSLQAAENAPVGIGVVPEVLVNIQTKLPATAPQVSVDKFERSPAPYMLWRIDLEQQAGSSTKKPEGDHTSLPQDPAASPFQQVHAEPALTQPANENAPPPEKTPVEKPIKFTDTFGRRFLFPYEKCKTYAGISELIKQAFQSLPIPEVQVNVELGHYDLVTRKDVTILPQAWETSVQPGITVSMHLWSMPINQPAPPEMDFIGSMHPPLDGGIERRLHRMNMQPPNPLAPDPYGISVHPRPQGPTQYPYASAAGPTGRADSGYQSYPNRSLFDHSQGHPPSWTR